MTLFQTKKNKFKTDIFFFAAPQNLYTKTFFGNITGSNAESKNFIFGPKVIFLESNLTKEAEMQLTLIHYIMCIIMN